MPKLYFPDQATAQTQADALHTWLLANDAAYAASVASGQTKRWAFPLQDASTDGVALSTQWFVHVFPRCQSALSPLQVSALTT